MTHESALLKGSGNHMGSLSQHQRLQRFVEHWPVHICPQSCEDFLWCSEDTFLYINEWTWIFTQSYNFPRYTMNVACSHVTWFMPSYLPFRRTAHTLKQSELPSTILITTAIHRACTDGACLAKHVANPATCRSRSPPWRALHFCTSENMTSFPSLA